MTSHQVPLTSQFFQQLPVELELLLSFLTVFWKRLPKYKISRRAEVETLQLEELTAMKFTVCG